MTEASARKALRRLARTGLVERTGNGKKNQFALCREGSLAEAVCRLFELERDRGEALAQAVRKTIRCLSSPPRMAWVQDYLAGWSDCQEVALFYDDDVEAAGVTELKERLVEVEEEFEVVLEVRALPHAEMAEVDWSSVVPVFGTPPGNGSRGSGTGSGERPPGENPFSGNGKLNPESPEFSVALVAFLEENLSVLRRARENVRGRLRQPQNGEGHDLWEWQKILDTFSFPRLLHFLESDSPRAVRLRECSPFPAVLSEEEEARLAQLANRAH